MPLYVKCVANAMILCSCVSLCYLEPFLPHSAFIWLKLFCWLLALPHSHRGFLKLNSSPCDVELLTAVIPEKCCVRFWHDIPKINRKTNWLLNLLHHWVVALILHKCVLNLFIISCPIFFLFSTL